MTPDVDALLALHFAAGATAPRRTLLERYGSPVAAVAAGASAWRNAGLDAPQIAVLRGHSDAMTHEAVQRAQAWLQSPRHAVIGWHDEDYPALLRRAPNPPLVLFVAGDPTLLWHPSVAIVGSRGPTTGGRDNASMFTRQLVEAGLAIASGMAAGIDRVAHETALDAGGVTIAVLGTGPDVAYPYEHAALLAQIEARGVVISEHAPGTCARREHFPSRNRILAGLSLGTLVIEAAQRSGALITARLATDAGREVFAVPGSIHNPMTRGCHRLIRDGATLVEHAGEVIDALQPGAAALGDALRARLELPSEDPGQATKTGACTAVSHPSEAPSLPDAAHHRLWCALGHDPSNMDQLVARTGLTAAALSSMLLAMQLNGLVDVQYGRYSRRDATTFNTAP